MNDCKSCWARYLCAGGCFANNISSLGDRNKMSKEKCEIIKFEWKFIIKLYNEIKLKFPELLDGSKSNEKQVC